MGLRKTFLSRSRYNGRGYRQRKNGNRRMRGRLTIEDFAGIRYLPRVEATHWHLRKDRKSRLAKRLFETPAARCSLYTIRLESACGRVLFPDLGGALSRAQLNRVGSRRPTCLVCLTLEY